MHLIKHAAHLANCASLTLTLKLTQPIAQSPTLILTLTPLQVRCTIDQILCNLSNAAQWINCPAAQCVWSNAQLLNARLYNNIGNCGTAEVQLPCSFMPQRCAELGHDGIKCESAKARRKVITKCENVCESTLTLSP